MTSPSLPSTHRALIFTHEGQPLEVQTRPTPQAGPGSVLVRVNASRIPSYAREVFDGTRPHGLPTPMVAGAGGIGHVVAVGPDATSVTPGQLVYIELTVRARDEPSIAMLQGWLQGSAKKLSEGEWRDGSWAEYVKVPLENVFPLNEARLVRELGYTEEDLAFLPTLAVPFGGLRNINLQAGETIVISPATGGFGSAAVMAAVAMGAKVIAMGRNKTELAKLEGLSNKVVTVPITGDEATDMEAIGVHGPVDAVLDISPAAAAQSTHIRSAILSLRPRGRVALMAGIMGDHSMPHGFIVQRAITLKGTFMYSREDFQLLTKMVEKDILKIGEKASIKTVGRFSLDQWKNAFDSAFERVGFGEMSVFLP